jgi:hypothetical protein
VSKSHRFAQRGSDQPVATMPLPYAGPPAMPSRVQSRHGRRAGYGSGSARSRHHRTDQPTALKQGPAQAETDLPVAHPKIGRFEIFPELAILTSDILGSESSTTLVEQGPVSFRAAASVTVHPVVEDGHMSGEG